MNNFHMNGLDLRLLIVLDSLLELRNVTQAAKRLRQTQSGVSHALAKLRRVLDDPLFVSVPGGMMPTERALAMAGPIRTALEHVRVAVAPAIVFDGARSSEPVSMLTNDFVGQALLPPLLRNLRQKAPGRPVRVGTLDARTDWLRLEDGSFDVAVAYFSSKVPDQLYARPLFDEHYVVVARVGHPGIGKRLTLEKYARAEHVGVFPYVTGIVDAALLQDHKLARRVTLALPSLQLIPELLAESDYLCTVGSRVAQSFAERQSLAIHKLPFRAGPIAISMVWHARRHWDASHRWFREQMLETAAAL